MNNLATLISSNAVPVDASHRLRVSVFNAEVTGFELVLRWRVLDENGKIQDNQQTFTVEANATTNSPFIPVGVGQLIDVILTDLSGQVTFGTSWTTISLFQGSGDSATLIQQLTTGYIAANVAVAWPRNQSSNPLDSNGASEARNFGNMTTGQDLSITIGSNQYCRLVNLTFTFVEAGAGTAQAPQIIIEDGIIEIFRFLVRTAPTVSATSRYSGVLGGALPNDSGEMRYFPIPDQIAGREITVRTDTTGIDIGDKYQSVNASIQYNLGA